MPPQAVRLRLQVLVLLLQPLLDGGGLLGSLLNIVDHILLVESAERDAFECVVLHGPLLSFPNENFNSTLAQNPGVYKGLKINIKNPKNLLHFEIRHAII